MPDRVLEQVRQHPLEESGIGLDEWQVFRHVNRHSPARAWHRQERGADHLVERHGHCLDAECPSLEPARVEQVLDDPIEAVRRLLDRREQLTALLLRPLDVRLAQRADRRP